MCAKRLRIPDLMEKMERKEKIVMITAYDYLAAEIADRCGVDMILVGDSLGNVVLGYDSTTQVTMEDMIHHVRPVVRGTQRALIVADMPFGSYQTGMETALENGVRLIKEGGAAALKLEGGQPMVPLVKAMTEIGIPVMAHIGLMPQTAKLWAGNKVQGRDEAGAWELVDAAQALEEAGAFAILLECVAAEAAALISEKVDVPTIGIGSGAGCDGQVLVGPDLYGLNTGRVPSFVKQYGDVAGEMSRAIQAYIEDVKEGRYPGEGHSFPMEKDEARKLY